MTENSFSFILLYSFIQGFSEFIPISSSGHLNILENLWGKSESRNLLFETTAHFSTLLALIIYFVGHSKDNIKGIINKNYMFIIIGTIPALIVGLTIKLMNYNFVSLKIIGISSIAGAIVLLIADKYKNLKIKSKSENLDFLIAGLFQCFAFIPGFSRSGACISGFLFTGKSKKDSVVYSLLMSFPIITISFLSNLGDLAGTQFSFDLILIFTLSFIVAYGTLVFFIKYINQVGFLPYITYRILLGFIILIFFI